MQPKFQYTVNNDIYEKGKHQNLRNLVFEIFKIAPENENENRSNKNIRNYRGENIHKNGVVMKAFFVVIISHDKVGKNRYFRQKTEDEIMSQMGVTFGLENFCIVRQFCCKSSCNPNLNGTKTTARKPQQK